VARQAREAIEKNEPEAGLDRLHTFMARYLRVLCQQRGIQVPQDKPLHSLMGEYVRALKQQRKISSDMTERIMKSSISTLDAFNAVRNNQSLAHPSALLNYNESLLIFNHVTALVRFIESIEQPPPSKQRSSDSDDFDDDIPF
jgi:Abortive infection C-terminus